MKLLIIDMTVIDLNKFNVYLFDSIFSFSQNLESCRYLLPKDEISIEILRPSLISTLSHASRYFMYFFSTVFKKSWSMSFKLSKLTVGIILSKFECQNFNDLWQRFPKLAKSSLLFLSMNSFQLN